MKTVKNLSMIVGLMLLTTLFLGIGMVQTSRATTIIVSGTPIQNAINASANGGMIVVAAGHYVQNLVVNKSITLVSAAGYATTWINGTINVTVNGVQIGNATGNGFTIYKSVITAGTYGVTIGTNASRNLVKVQSCEIIGGYDGINIGKKGKDCTNITIHNNIIHGQGKSTINASSGWLKNSNISNNICYNSSNTVAGAILLFDGAYNTVIWDNIIHSSTDNGGAGINFTGSNNATDKVNIMHTNIYDTGNYSPIVIRSKASTEYAQNIKIEFCDLTNNSQGLTCPAIRFDNISGQITASNITTEFNNMDTSSRDIEERFALTSIYKNWTGVMPAYFNWYGSAAAGTFRNASHLYATPYAIASNGMTDIATNGLLVMTGATTGALNATIAHLKTSTITSTASLTIVAYPYATALLQTYPARSMHKYIELGVSNTSRITYPVNITIYYNTSDLATRGWDEDTIHGLTRYNATSGDWEQFNDTGVITTDQWGSFKGCAWGKAYNAYELTGVILGIDYNTITTTPPGGGTTTPPGGGTTTPPGGGTTIPPTTTTGAIPTSTWILVGVIIAILIVVCFLVILLANPKLRKKWFG